MVSETLGKIWKYSPHSTRKESFEKSRPQKNKQKIEWIQKSTQRSEGSQNIREKGTKPPKKKTSKETPELDSTAFNRAKWLNLEVSPGPPQSVRGLVTKPTSDVALLAILLGRIWAKVPSSPPFS